MLKDVKNFLNTTKELSHMKEFTLEDFDYKLPKELIAQEHAVPRDHSRMMVVKDKIYHKHFYDLLEFLERGDTLVLNNTKVLPARFFGQKITGGKVEILLIRKLKDNKWECLVKGKKVRESSELVFDNFKGKVLYAEEEGKKIIEFDKDIAKVLNKGIIPLPPYIKKKLDDPSMYQTVYSKKEGAIAAPTAGLHFTKELIDKLKSVGVNFAEITLHVSLGTFRPVHDLKTHKMDEEYYEVSKESAEIINKTNAEGRRLFAVGTTSVRTLETVSSENGEIIPGSGFSNIFIKPGYKFKSGISGIITNFHIPKSTLLMMITAFGGYERVMNAYKVAIEKKYRFYSFGDSMFLFKDEKRE